MENFAKCFVCYVLLFQDNLIWNGSISFNKLLPVVCICVRFKFICSALWNELILLGLGYGRRGRGGEVGCMEIRKLLFESKIKSHNHNSRQFIANAGLLIFASMLRETINHFFEKCLVYSICLMGDIVHDIFIFSFICVFITCLWFETR